MIIVGLGNPGKAYEKTRHNVGFMFVDQLAEAWNTTFRLEKKHQCLMAEKQMETDKVLLIKPITYMNNSGLSVRSVLDYYQLLPDQLLVVYDDMDLPLASVRIRKSGSSGGHKGMKSIIDQLGTSDIKRIRIGIGENNIDVVDYVLSTFSKAELTQINKVFELAPNILEDLMTKGFDYIMNHYNG